MEYRLFGKTGMKVSVLGFGGAEIGFEQATESNVTELLAAALDAGLNVIDTAECYVTSEELIGTAIGNRRDEFHLFTKCGHGKDYMTPAWSAADIRQSVDRSLQRLKTDHVDLLQLHSPSADILEKGECLEALQEAKKAGKTRFIGYSGDGQDAVYALKLGIFDAFQTSVSIADQEAIDLTIPMALEQNLGVIAKRPIANAAWRQGRKPDNEYAQPYWERLQELQYDFINGDLNHSIEVALRFTLSVPGVHTMIVGTSKPGRWIENARLVEMGRLPDMDYQQIRTRWNSVARPDWVGQV